MRHVPDRILRAVVSRPRNPCGQGSGGTLAHVCSPPLLWATASCPYVPHIHHVHVHVHVHDHAHVHAHAHVSHVDVTSPSEHSSPTLGSPAFGQAQLQARRRPTLTGFSTITSAASQVACLNHSSSSRSYPCQILTASYRFRLIGLPILWASTSCLRTTR